MSMHVVPRELILRIYDFVDPGSHLDFALTCKQIFELSRDILKHHVKCSTLYRVCSDRTISSLPALLHLLVTDHIAAWHVRSFEVWNASAFLESSEDSIGQLFRSRASHEIETTSMKDMLLWYKSGSSYQQWNFFGDGEETLVQDIHILEALVFGMCPRLQSVKYLRQNCHPYQYLSDAVRRISIPKIPEWPQGYQSLRNISLGFLGHMQNEVFIQAARIAPLFFLPNIETMYIAWLGFDEDEDDDLEIIDETDNGRGDRVTDHDTFLLPSNSSSVKHLYFEEAQGLARYQIEKFIKSAKNLETLIFKNCEFDDFDQVVSLSATCQADSLRTLIYHGDRDLLNGYRCSRFRPEELKEFHVLSTVVLDPYDVRLDSCYEYGTRGEIDGLSGNVARYDDFVNYFQTAIPRSIETLIFSGIDEETNEKDNQAFDDALVRLIEEGNCPLLKALYLEYLENNAPMPGPEGGWFRKTVECGRKHGIEVYTRADGGSTAQCLEDICAPVIELSYGLTPVVGGNDE